MDKSRPVSLLIDLLEINDEFARVVLGVCKYLCTEQSNDMVADHVDIGFILEIRIIDSEVGVEPVDFAGDELLGDEALEDEEDQKQNYELEEKREYLCGDFCLDMGSLFFLALEHGSRISREILDSVHRGVAGFLAERVAPWSEQIGSRRCRHDSIRKERNRGRLWQIVAWNNAVRYIYTAWSVHGS